MKSIIDANVILRYILDDNKEMAEEAARVIQNGARTLPEVIAEVVYVLAKSIRRAEKILRRICGIYWMKSNWNVVILCCLP